MIILPEKGLTKVLMPIPLRDWRTPSAAQPKNSLGHATQCRFTITARDKPYGAILWRGWYDDREDYDAVLWGFASGAIAHDCYLQRLVAGGEAFGDLDPAILHEPVWWENHTWWFLTGPVYPTTTTWTVPADCNGVSSQSGEFIDTIGGAGSGAVRTGSTIFMVGGSGGGWSQITTLSLTPSSSVNTQIGTGGAGVTGSDAAGNSGTDTWFNGANLAASSVGAKAGIAGTTGTATVTGKAGGAAGSGIGTTKFSGGASGTCSHTNSPTGGGGGAGSSGDGGAGTNSSATNTSTAGGNGDNGVGGAGSAGNSAGNSSAGGNGTEYDASHGSGGASGGARGSGASSGVGGNYGAGSGGRTHTVGNTPGSGNAGPGLIAMAYVAASSVIAPFQSWGFPDFGRPNITYRYH